MDDFDPWVPDDDYDRPRTELDLDAFTRALVDLPTDDEAPGVLLAELLGDEEQP